MSDDFAKQQLLNEVKMRAAKIREFVNSLEAAMNARYRGSPEALAALEEMRRGLKMAVRDGAGEKSLCCRPPFHMDVLGIDFTSTPKSDKPLIRLSCSFDG